MAYSLEKQRQMLILALSEIKCVIGVGGRDILDSALSKEYKDTAKYLSTLIDKINNRIKKKLQKKL